MKKRYSKREIERERERDFLEKLLVLTLVHISHGFCLTLHEKCANFLKDYCMIFHEKPCSKRERERERDLLEKLLVMILVLFSHGFCHTFQKNVYFLKFYCERERERSPRKVSGIDSAIFFTWILSYFSSEMCIVFKKLLCSFP